MTKQELRVIYKDLRMALPIELRTTYDQSIREELLIHLGNKKNVGIFLPIEKFNEIDLSPLLSVKKYNWYLPISFFLECEMEFAQVNSKTHLVVSPQGISEPKGTSFIAPSLLDAIVVPMLISDRLGFRVGYGKGFYDYFLKRCKSSCLKIGVSYFEPIEAISDVENHDMPLDLCIFPH